MQNHGVCVELYHNIYSKGGPFPVKTQKKFCQSTSFSKGHLLPDFMSWFYNKIEYWKRKLSLL